MLTTRQTNHPNLLLRTYIIFAQTLITEDGIFTGRLKIK